MVRVVKASGEEALAIALTDFAIEEHPIRVLAIKRHLQRLTGQPRFSGLKRGCPMRRCKWRFIASTRTGCSSMAKSVRAMARASSPDTSASVFGWPDGQMLTDDVVLQGHTDLQLILLPFETSSQDQIRHLQEAAASTISLR